jgi:protein-S-isoprenylcysteine O-methyltransferase
VPDGRRPRTGGSGDGGSAVVTPLALQGGVATLAVFGPLLGSAALEGLHFRRDAGRIARDRTYWVIQLWQLAGLALAVLLAQRVPSAALPGAGWAWVAVGCAIGLAGVALRAWSIATLGTSFTRNLQVTPTQRLVRSGPYRALRHPSYTGAILIFCGIGVGLGNALAALAATALPAFGYVLRVPHEEALLRQRFGADYDDYVRHSDRLVPRVW